MTNHDASACASRMSMRELEERQERLATEITALDADLRTFMAAENPARGIVHAGDLHRLRQEKLQKRLEMEYCRGRMRLLQSEGNRILLQ